MTRVIIVIIVSCRKPFSLLGSSCSLDTLVTLIETHHFVFESLNKGHYLSIQPWVWLYKLFYLSIVCCLASQ